MVKVRGGVGVTSAGVTMLQRAFIAILAYIYWLEKSRDKLPEFPRFWQGSTIHHDGVYNPSAAVPLELSQTLSPRRRGLRRRLECGRQVKRRQRQSFRRGREKDCTHGGVAGANEVEHVGLEEDHGRSIE